MIFIAWFKSLV